MPNVVLINAFEVPADQDEAFLRGWEAVRDVMQGRPGYVSARLHASLDPAARFRFVNVAVWATPADFQAAVRHPEVARLQQALPFVNFPAPYEVIRTD